MSVFSLADLAHPIVQAPMAGGPTTPQLVRAVSGAGGLGFLAAGYRSVDAVRADVRAVRVAEVPFGVNLFAPPGHGGDPAGVAAYAATLAGEAARSGVALGEPRWDDDHYADKIAMLAAERVPVVSLAFGLPSRADVALLHAAGTALWVTVTTQAEARAAVEAGADALVVQGVEAGGHRGGFDDAHPGDVGLLALLQLVRAAVPDTPLAGAGGVATGAGVAAVLAAGAAAAVLGTAFLPAAEAGTAPAQRAALSGTAPTALTRAFTGRTARGIANRFLREHTSGAPAAYPEVHHLTAGIRTAAKERGDAEGFHLWAGQAYPLAEPAAAAELVVRLSGDARAALDAARARFW